MTRHTQVPDRDFETLLRRWPIFDDRQHWKAIASTGYTKFFPAEDGKDLKNRVAEFQMDVRAAMGQPVEEISAELALKEADKIIAEATDFTVDDLLRVKDLFKDFFG